MLYIKGPRFKHSIALNGPSYGTTRLFDSFVLRRPRMKAQPFSSLINNRTSQCMTSFLNISNTYSVNRFTQKSFGVIKNNPLDPICFHLPVKKSV